MTIGISIEDVARVCHEANRAYCRALGDNSQPHWETAPDWQKQSALNGVDFHIRNPEAKASASHESWMKEKLENGWKYGEVKDPEAKTHPCIVPFDELPLEQQKKDVLFKAVVDSLR